MAFYSLLTNIEKQVSDYLRNTFQGTYPIAEGFSVAPIALPVVVVKAARFNPLAPDAHVYTGTLSVSVITQVDDVADPLAVHDENLAYIYDAMSATGALLAHTNATGSRLHVYQIHGPTIDQDAALGDGGERSLVTILEYTITAQTLEVE